MDEFWRNQKGRSSWGFTFVSVTIYTVICLGLIRINISHCSKTGGNSTKQTHLDHWKVPKHGRLEIIFHVCEIRLWKLTQARCYQPVSICTDFHHQDFSTIAVDTQEWNGGSWGCGWGRMYCKVWHCAGRASWDGVHAYTCSFFRPQILSSTEFMVRENWMYTILLPPSTQFPLWESTNFPKIQVYQVSHVDVHQVLGGIQSLIYWRGKWWNFMKLNVH